MKDINTQNNTPHSPFWKPIFVVNPSPPELRFWDGNCLYNNEMNAFRNNDNHRLIVSWPDPFSHHGYPGLSIGSIQIDYRRNQLPRLTKLHTNLSHRQREAPGEKSLTFLRACSRQRSMGINWDTWRPMASTWWSCTSKCENSRIWAGSGRYIMY